MAAETVAVLFTDWVGSTELLHRLGEAAAEALRVELYRLLREGAAAGRGRDVKNVGDGMMFAFSSASSCLTGAVAIQQAIAEFNRSAAEPIAVRCGAAIGDADVAEGDYFGVTVVEASRLCDRAGAGQILVANSIRMMARDRADVVYRSVGELQLKGFDEPVPAFDVAWEPPVSSKGIPLPKRLERAPKTPFVGRNEELEALHAALKQVATSGERGVVFLAGEAGIGKTSLVAEFAREVHAADVTLLYGRYDEDLGVPYQAWVEALDYLASHARQEVLDAHVRARKGQLCALVPSLATRVALEGDRSLDAESERYLLYGAVVDLLARACRTGPLVLVLDDLHWSDRPSMQLLRHVISSATPLRVLIIGAFRDSDLGPSHPLAETLATLHREPDVERVMMRGLGDDDLLEMLETTAGHSLEDDGIALRDALVKETEGNPFFVGEILRHLAETGAIGLDSAGHWVTPDDVRAVGLPVSVREVVMRRVLRLGDETLRALSIAAVIGRDFDFELLAAALDEHDDDDHLLDILEGALAAALIAETDVPGRFTFVHVLIERALYDELSAARRARAHRAIAECLEEQLSGDSLDRAGELAYHWTRAVQPQDVEKAIAASQRAGDRALEQLAPEEAVRWYREALDLLDRALRDDARTQAELLVSLGDAQRQMGDPAHRETLIAAADLADQHGYPDLVTRAALANNRGWASSVGDPDDERIRILRRALETCERESPERARLLATLCAELLTSADFETRLRLADEAVAAARNFGDGRTLVDVLMRPHMSILSPTTLSQRVAWMDEACEIADRLQDPVMRFGAYVNRHMVAFEEGNREWIDRGFETMFAEAAHIGQPTYLWVATFEQAARSCLDGQLEAAEEHAGAALQLGMETGQPDALKFFGLQILTIRWMQGRLAEMAPLLEQMYRDRPDTAALVAALALCRLEVDDPDGARLLLDQTTANGFDIFPDNGWLAAHVMWSLVAARLRHGEAASVLYDRLEPWHNQFVHTHLSSYGSIAHFLGLLTRLLGDDDRAEAYFDEAFTLHQGMRAPFFTALTETAWAELLVERRQGDDLRRATELLVNANATAEGGGYREIESRARSLLANT